MIIARYILSTAIAVCITLGLFYVMYSLVRVTEPHIDKSAQTHVIDFVRLKRDETTQTKQRKLPDQPPPQDQPPPPPDLAQAKPDYASASGPKITMNFANAGGLHGGVKLGQPAADRDATSLLVSTSPLVYPNRARSAGKEGYADIQFTVTKTGQVVDAQVIDENPDGWGFGQAAVKTVQRWRYQPKLVDGKPVERPGLRFRIRFQLSNK
ncbi:MAG TPA: energy transducer TonB [Alphaproteobacteria bacterium]|nr:energy transducer TonB [Alphaproteobacteria bacterium]